MAAMVSARITFASSYPHAVVPAKIDIALNHGAESVLFFSRQNEKLALDKKDQNVTQVRYASALQWEELS